MGDKLYTLWFVVTASDAVGAIFAVALLRRLGTRFGKFLAWFLLGVAVEALVAAATLYLFFPRELELAPAFALWRIAGRGVKCASVWGLVVYLFGFCKRNGKGA